MTTGIAPVPEGAALPDTSAFEANVTALEKIWDQLLADHLGEWVIAYGPEATVAFGDSAATLLDDIRPELRATAALRFVTRRPAALLL